MWIVGPSNCLHALCKWSPMMMSSHLFTGYSLNLVESIIFPNQKELVIIFLPKCSHFTSKIPKAFFSMYTQLNIFLNPNLQKFAFLTFHFKNTLFILSGIKKKKNRKGKFSLNFSKAIFSCFVLPISPSFASLCNYCDNKNQQKFQQ